MPGLVDDPKGPIHLLIYAVQTAVTTSTCIADYLSWKAFDANQKFQLGTLYVPYLAICRSFFRSVVFRPRTSVLIHDSCLYGSGYV